MKKTRFGLIGYGKVAGLHVKALSDCSNAQLVSVCGRSEKRCSTFAQKWKIPAHKTPAEMVKEDGVEAVIITTPHPAHCTDAISALEAGCHVLIEKPMALTVAECDDILAAAAKAGKKVGVISQRRWYPSCQRIKEAITANKLGQPALAQVTMLGWRDEDYYKSDPWRGKWDTEGGGVLINQAPHQLDLLAWFMGPVAEVQSYWTNVNHPYIEVEDTAVAIVKFKSGGIASILVSNSQKPGIYAKVHIHGSSGASAGVQTDGGAMFIAGMSGITEPPFNDIWTIPGEEDRLGPWKTADEQFFSTIDATTWFFTRQIEDFADAITTGRPPLVTGEDGRETVKLIEGIYRSSREGRPIRYD